MKINCEIIWKVKDKEIEREGHFLFQTIRAFLNEKKFTRRKNLWMVWSLAAEERKQRMTWKQLCIFRENHISIIPLGALAHLLK